MAKNINFLNNNTVGNINTNFQRVNDALEDVIARSGELPNNMEADLDMDGNDILNVGILQAEDITVDGSNVTGVLERALIAAEAAEVQADRSENEADRAEQEADRAALNAQSVVDRAWFKTVAEMLADDNSHIGYVGSGADFEVGPGDIVEAEGSRFEVLAHDDVTAPDATEGGVNLKKVSGWPERVAANVRGRVNFFDFLQETRSTNDREDIANGTFTGDLAVEWQAFRDALQAIADNGGRPYGFIPECKIYSSVAPNFAMDYLTLETQGHVRIEAIGAVPGFLIDGMGLGVNGYGVRHMSVGPLCASTVTGSAGVRVRRVHQSDFWGFQSLGAAFAGIWLDGCVSSNFHKPTVSPQAEPFLANPPVGMYLSSSSGGDGSEPWHAPIQVSWCKFDVPVVEYTAIGIQLDQTFGNTFIGGTAEGCSDRGFVLGADALYNKLVGIDMEFNTNHNIYCEGSYNEFYGADAGGFVGQLGTTQFAGSAKGNRIFGGFWDSVVFGLGTKLNSMNGSYVNTLTDASTGPDRNRFHNVMDWDGNWRDRWLTWAPAVVASSGSLGSATAYGEYKVRDGDTVDFQISISITTNGTGAGELRFLLPYAPALETVFSGMETGVTMKSVSAFAQGEDKQVHVLFADGTYPGADGAVIVISGTYRRS